MKKIKTRKKKRSIIKVVLQYVLATIIVLMFIAFLIILWIVPHIKIND